MAEYKIDKTVEVLTKPEERRLITLAKEGNVKARSSLIIHNIRFVVSVANEYRASAEPNELIGEGIIGLDYAIGKFDLGKNYKFITYAVNWIRASITQYLNERHELIRIPTNVKHELRKVKRTEEYKKTGRMKDKLEMMEILRGSGVRLDKPVHGKEGVSTFQDLISDKDKTKTPGNSGRLSVQKFISDLLERLTKIERTVLQGLYGIEQDRMTLQELSNELELSVETVRNIKRNTFKRINKFKDKQELLDSYLEEFRN